MVTSAQSRQMTAEEYLEWESLQENRHEYCNGEVSAMESGTKDSDMLAFNLRLALYDRIEERGYKMSGLGVKVQIQKGLSYRYPDLTVSCDEHEKTNGLFYKFPKLIVEVLTAESSADDRGVKFHDYQCIPTLQEYVLVDSRKVYIECYRRSKRRWEYRTYDAGETVTLFSIGTEVSVDEIYEGILDKSLG